MIIHYYYYVKKHLIDLTNKKQYIHWQRFFAALQYKYSILYLTSQPVNRQI